MKSKTLTFLIALFAFAVSNLSGQEFDVYISDAGNFNNSPWQIAKFDESGSNGMTLVPSNELGWPQDIVFLEDEDIMLVSNLNLGTITRFNASTGAKIDEFATGIGGPTRMKIGADGLLYVLQWSNNTKVQRYELDGTFVDDFTQEDTGTAIGLDWDADGNLYVSSFNGKYVRKFGPDGTSLGDFITENLAGPTNIYFDDEGNLFVLDWQAGNVKKFDSEGVFQEVFISGVPQCEGVDFFPNGDIIIGVGEQGTAKIYSSDGTFIRDLFSQGELGIIRPNAVVLREKTVSSVGETYQEVNFIIPTVGKQFQVSNPNEVKSESYFEVYNSSGQFISKVNFIDSIMWDASHISSGVYHVRTKMNNGKIARQKIVVQ